MSKEEAQDKLYDLSEGTIECFNEIFDKKQNVSVKLLFQGNSKQKELIKIKKISEEYSYVLGKELLISINEDVMMSLDDECITILFEQEIDKVSVNMESGSIKMVKPDLSTFSGLVRKYGVDKVARANKVEELLISQTVDLKNDEQFIA